MRDVRFQHPREMVRRNELHVAADQLLMKLTTIDRAAVDELLAVWWIDVLGRSAQTQEWKTEQAVKLRSECNILPQVCQAFGFMVCDTLAAGTTDEAQVVAERLLGESAAAAIRNSSTVVTLDRAAEFLSDSWGAVEVMIECLSKAPAWPASLEMLTPSTAALSGLIEQRSKQAPTDDVLLEEEKNSRELGLLAFFGDRQRETTFLNEPTLVRLTLLAARNWRSLALQAEALPLREAFGKSSPLSIIPASRAFPNTSAPPCAGSSSRMAPSASAQPDARSGCHRGNPRV